jgi:hypothetical protein
MENKEIKLTVTVHEVNVILQSLGKQPYEIVRDLIGKITIQGNNQLTDKENGTN